MGMGVAEEGTAVVTAEWHGDSGRGGSGKRLRGGELIRGSVFLTSPFDIFGPTSLDGDQIGSMASRNKLNLQLLGNSVWELYSLGKRLVGVAKVDRKEEGLGFRLS